MNGKKLFTLAVALFLAFRGLSAQDAPVDTAVQDPVFHRLTWQAVEYASRYEVTVEISASSNEWIEHIRKTSVTETFIDFPLFAGKYRFRVSAFDLLGRPGSTTEWMYFEVRARIKAPEEAPVSGPAFSLSGEKNEPPRDASLFDLETLFTPLITLPFSSFNEIYTTDPFQPVGFSIRFTTYPFKRVAGTFGLGIMPFWNFLATEIYLKSRYTHLTGGQFFIAYQMRPFGGGITVNIRGGGGMTYISSRFDFNEGIDITTQGAWNPSANIGVSLQSSIGGALFLDAGLEYHHIFSKDNVMLNFLRPMIGIGWRFQNVGFWNRPD
jgi:hypothetical protein